MALPNDSIAVTPGSGATVATHTISGKEYQVVLVAGPSGHIENTQPTYYFNRAGAAGAANQRTLDIFNATGSGLVVRLKKLFLFHDQTAITGVGHRFELRRTTSVGTGGTSITAVKADSTDAALHANVTARASATGGAATSDLLFNITTNPEETLPAASMHSGVNWVPEGDGIKPIIINENEGVVLTQITSNTAGIWHALAVVTTD